jgi:hypothetical protein
VEDTNISQEEEKMSALPPVQSSGIYKPKRQADMESCLYRPDGSAIPGRVYEDSSPSGDPEQTGVCRDLFGSEAVPEGLY